MVIQTLVARILHLSSEARRELRSSAGERRVIRVEVQCFVGVGGEGYFSNFDQFDNNFDGSLNATGMGEMRKQIGLFGI